MVQIVGCEGDWHFGSLLGGKICLVRPGLPVVTPTHMLPRPLTSSPAWSHVATPTNTATPTHLLPHPFCKSSSAPLPGAGFVAPDMHNGWVVMTSTTQCC